METHILQHERAIREFSPDSFPNIDALHDGQRRLSQQSAAQSALILEKLSEIQEFSTAKSRDAGMLPREDSDEESPLDKQISRYRDLLKTGNSSTALKLLEDLWQDLPADVSGRIRFRIRANIGACMLNLDRRLEAGRAYLEAYEYAPDETNAAAFKVLALILLGKQAEAFEFGISKIDLIEDNSVLIAHTLVAAMDLPDLQNPLSFIPKDKEDDPHVLRAKISYFRAAASSWWDEADSAHKMYPDDDVLARIAAEAEIDRACSWMQENDGAVLPAETKGRLEKAIGTLSDQLEAAFLSPDSIRSFDNTLCLNLVTALRLCCDYDRAKKVLDRTLVVVPDEEELLICRAMIAVECGYTDDAIEALSNLSDTRDTILGRVQVYANSAQYEKVVELAERADVSELSESDRAFFDSVVLVARHRVKQLADPKKSVEVLLNQYPAEPVVPIILFEVPASIDDAAWASELYDAAKQRSAGLSLSTRHMLARVAEHECDYEYVVELLFDHVSVDVDSDELRTLTRALVNCRPRPEAISLIGALPENLVRTAFYANAAGSINFNRGDLVGAEQCFKIAIRSDSSDLFSHMSLIDTYMRTDNSTAVEEHLSRLELHTLRGPTVLKLGLAQRLIQYGYMDEGLDYGYRSILDDRQDGRASLLYVGLIFPSPSKIQIPPVGPEVTNDCTVEIKRGDGKSLQVTIEIGPDRPDIDHYNPEHPFAKALIGAQVGETVVFNPGGGGSPESWSVEAIQHKYLALLHEITGTFAARFPDMGGLQSITLPEGDVTPILERVKAKADADAQLLRLHIDNHIPLQMLARAMGQTTIDVAARLASRGMCVRTCVGLETEMQAALEEISKAGKSGIVMDSYTAWCAFCGGWLLALKSQFSRIIVPQSALDELRAMREGYQPDESGRLMVLSYENGRYCREELSTEQLAQSIETINNAIDAISDHCEVLPAVAPNAPTDAESRLLEVVRYGALDAIYLSSTEDLPLLSEDLSYRVIARELYQRPGVWLQAALMAALHGGHLSGSDYAKAIAELSMRKHSYISVNSPLLVAIAEADTEDRLVRLSAALEFLGVPYGDVDAHSRLGLEFLFQIWATDQISNFRRSRASSLVLERLLVMWSRTPNVSDRINWLMENTRTNPYLVEHIAKWLRGHFFIT